MSSKGKLDRNDHRDRSFFSICSLEMPAAPSKPSASGCPLGRSPPAKRQRAWSLHSPTAFSPATHSAAAFSPPSAISDFEIIRREKRQRTLVFRYVPESTTELPSQRQSADENFVTDLLDTLLIQVRPLCVFRLGTNKIRFLLAELPTKTFVSDALRNGYRLKSSRFNDVYVGRSMTKEERTDFLAKRRDRITTAAPSTVVDASPISATPKDSSPPLVVETSLSSPTPKATISEATPSPSEVQAQPPMDESKRRAVTLLVMIHKQHREAVNMCASVNHPPPPPLPPSFTINSDPIELLDCFTALVTFLKNIGS